MECKNNKVLHVGPGRSSRGGIAIVINAYFDGLDLNCWRLKRLETQSDRSFVTKNITLIKALVLAPVKIFNCNIIHIHTASNNSFRRKVYFIVLSRILRRKIILHIHGGGFDEFLKNMSPGKLKFAQKVIQMADVVICLSTKKMTEIGRLISHDNMKIIPNPCVFNPQGIKRDYEKNEKVLFVGWIEEEKGIFDLIKAVSELSSMFLVVAGKGRISDCQRLAVELGVNERIEFVGWLSPKDLINIYEDADIFCLPSYVEGIPMALLEAMSYGLPIITCPVGGVPDVVSDNVDALFVEPGAVDSIKDCLVRLQNDHDLKERLGCNAREKVEGYFTIPKISNKINLLYDSLVKGE